MKKKVLALLWAFNNPAWAFILAKELYDGLDGLSDSIEPPANGMKPNLNDEEGKLIDYLRKAGFTSSDDFSDLWDAVVANKDEMEKAKITSKGKIAPSDPEFDEDWEDDDEEPESMNPLSKPAGKKSTPLIQWKVLVNKMPDDIKNFVHPEKEPQMVEDKPWHQQVWEEAYESDEKSLIKEVETLLNDGHLRRAVKSIYDIGYIIKNKYYLSRLDFRNLLENTQINDPQYPGVWGDLRSLNQTSPTLYRIAEDLAWESN